MKGIVFALLNKMVEEKFGMETWDSLIDETHPSSRGIYTSSGTYDEKELFAYVGQLSAKTKIPPADLVRAFGTYMMGELTRMFPIFFQGKTPKQFLQSIHSVIHVEVQKLYPDALLPKITYEDPGQNQLVMIYHSPRKLCHLGEGLMDGAALFYGVKLDRKQTKCLHQGDDHCRFELTIHES